MDDIVDDNEPDSTESPDELVRHPSFYEVLDVPNDAEEMEIDHAFARFLQEPGNDPRLMSQRKHAWEVLRDPINRSFYDEYLAKLLSTVRVLTRSGKRGIGSMSTFTLGPDLQGIPGEAPTRGHRR